MDLSDKQAEQFWPLCEQYTQELVAKQDRKYALLKEYAGNYTTMTDEGRRNMFPGARMSTRRSSRFGSSTSLHFGKYSQDNPALCSFSLTGGLG
jgi:hypothetical protein